MRLFQTLFVFVLAVECLHAQVNKPLYVVDGEFDGGQTSTLYRINPNDAAVLEVVGDTGENLLTIAVDPETGDLIGLTAPDSANADSLVRIDPHTAAASLIVALVPPDGEDMPEFLDMFYSEILDGLMVSVIGPGNGSGQHFVNAASGQVSDPWLAKAPLITGRNSGVAARQTVFPGAGFMVMFGCDEGTGASRLLGYAAYNSTVPIDPPPPWVSIPLPDQTCVTAGTRADGHMFYGVGVPFAEGASRTLVRIDLADDGSAEVETLGPLPDDSAGIAFGPIPQPSAIPALGGTGRALLVGLLLLAAGFMVRRTVRKGSNSPA